MTLTEFLLARIAEDEAQANLSLADLATNPNLRIPASWVEGVAGRVLAECAAKRAILEAHPLTTDVAPVWTGSTPGYACDNCARLSKADPKSIVEDIGACDTLMALAAIYADHADYDEAWRP